MRLAQKSRSDGGTDYFRMSGGKVEAEPIAQVGLDDSLTTAPLGFTADGKTLYWTDSRGRDTAALVAQDVASGKTRVIAQDPRADISNGLFHPVTGQVQAYAVEYLKQEYVPLTPSDQGRPGISSRSAAKGEFRVVSRTDADDKWVVNIDRVTAPGSTWLYERKGKRLTKLYVAPARARRRAAGADVPAGDQGARRPDAGVVPDAAEERRRRTATARPTSRCRWCCSCTAARGRATATATHGYHQWLANRGYAVLSVNYRGSTGFGKNFITSGDLQWGRKMHDDLLDAVDWAVKSGVTTRDKVAIMGGSYGGYATLAGMAFTPTTFACGVDIVGPSNLFTLLKTIPPYWEAGKQQFYKRMGDPTTEAGQALAEGALAAALCRQDLAAAADRAGRQRPARECGRVRPDRGGDERQEYPGDVRGVPG